MLFIDSGRGTERTRGRQMTGEAGQIGNMACADSGVLWDSGFLLLVSARVGHAS